MLGTDFNDVVIYDLIPGFRYRVKFVNAISLSEFKVLVDEDEEYNKAFNPKSSFNFDMFRDYLLGTNIPEAMKNTTPETYVLTFIMTNHLVLEGTGIDNFSEGLYCVDVKVPSGSLLPDLFEKFCEQYHIPHLKALYKGPRIVDEESITALMNHSALAQDGQVYGLVHRAAYEADLYQIQMPDQEPPQSTVDPLEEATRVVDEYVHGKAGLGGKWLREQVFDVYGGNPRNPTRAYNSIINALHDDLDFGECHDAVLVLQDEDWFQKNLRKMVKKYFKDILDEFRMPNK